MQIIKVINQSTNQSINARITGHPKWRVRKQTYLPQELKAWKWPAHATTCINSFIQNSLSHVSLFLSAYCWHWQHTKNVWHMFYVRKCTCIHSRIFHNIRDETWHHALCISFHSITLKIHSVHVLAIIIQMLLHKQLTST